MSLVRAITHVSVYFQLPLNDADGFLPSRSPHTKKIVYISYLPHTRVLYADVPTQQHNGDEQFCK